MLPILSITCIKALMVIHHWKSLVALKFALNWNIPTPSDTLSLLSIQDCKMESISQNGTQDAELIYIWEIAHNIQEVYRLSCTWTRLMFRRNTMYNMINFLKLWNGMTHPNPGKFSPASTIAPRYISPKGRYYEKYFGKTKLHQYFTKNEWRY